MPQTLLATHGHYDHWQIFKLLPQNYITTGGHERIFIAPQGHFRRPADLEYEISECASLTYLPTYVRTEIYEAPWGNGCGRVAPASALGFGSVCGMGQVRRFCGPIEGDRPRTWSDRRRPNRTYISRNSLYGVAGTGWSSLYGLETGCHCRYRGFLADPHCFPAGPHAVRGWI